MILVLQEAGRHSAVTGRRGHGSHEESRLEVCLHIRPEFLPALRDAAQAAASRAQAGGKDRRKTRRIHISRSPQRRSSQDGVITINSVTVYIDAEIGLILLPVRVEIIRYGSYALSSLTVTNRMKSGFKI